MTRYAPLALAALSFALMVPAQTGWAAATDDAAATSQPAKAKPAKTTSAKGTTSKSAASKSAASKSAAPKSSCSRMSTKWGLNLPAGQSDATANIIDNGENKIWWIGVGAVPPNAQLVIEYKQQSGIRGEVVLTSNAAELVQGASVDMHLRRASASGGRLAVAGSYHIQCK